MFCVIQIIMNYNRNRNESNGIIKISSSSLSLYCYLGEAAKYILSTEFGDNWKENVKVIFAGDDTTDEDAMKVNICTCVIYANLFVPNFDVLYSEHARGKSIRSKNSNLINFMIF